MACPQGSVLCLLLLAALQDSCDATGAVDNVRRSLVPVDRPGSYSLLNPQSPTQDQPHPALTTDPDLLSTPPTGDDTNSASTGHQYTGFSNPLPAPNPEPGADLERAAGDLERPQRHLGRPWRGRRGARSAPSATSAGEAKRNRYRSAARQGSPVWRAAGGRGRPSPSPPPPVDQPVWQLHALGRWPEALIRRLAPVQRRSVHSDPPSLEPTDFRSEPIDFRSEQVGFRPELADFRRGEFGAQPEVSGSGSQSPDPARFRSGMVVVARRGVFRSHAAATSPFPADRSRMFAWSGLSRWPLRAAGWRSAGDSKRIPWPGQMSGGSPARNGEDLGSLARVWPIPPPHRPPDDAAEDGVSTVAGPADEAALRWPAGTAAGQQGRQRRRVYLGPADGGGWLAILRSQVGRALLERELEQQEEEEQEQELEEEMEEELEQQEMEQGLERQEMEQELERPEMNQEGERQEMERNLERQ